MIAQVKKLIPVAFLFASVAAVAGESTTCRGSYWAYSFKFENGSCLQEQKVTKDIPGAYKKGHISKFDKSGSEDCWKSIAKIQMDGAKCCVTGDMSESSISCASKKLFY